MTIKTRVMIEEQGFKKLFIEVAGISNQTFVVMEKNGVETNRSNASIKPKPATGNAAIAVQRAGFNPEDYFVLGSILIENRLRDAYDSAVVEAARLEADALAAARAEYYAPHVAKARETGLPVAFDERADRCDGSVCECNEDLVWMVANPDGSIIERRSHIH